MSLSLGQLLQTMVEHNGSDLHITLDSPPQIRIDGSLVKLKTNPLTAEDSRELCYSVLSEAQRARFEAEQELDFSFDFHGVARFRGNMFMQKGAVAGVFRLIPARVRSFNDLGLPPIVAELCQKPRGLVLVTGPTGSGKSTTLAAMIDKINTDERGHIVTIEDPIEFVHQHKGCVINQREVGSDTQSFRRALKYILRQDPDVVLVGELRDLETIEAALTVAETGHLVFATLHTNSALATVNRVIDVFPSHQQAQVRAQLSMVLEGVLSQTLVPKVGGGRALALEILVATPGIRNLIREEKVHQLYSQMQIGQQKTGMQTLNQCLAGLVARRQVTLEDALLASSDPDELRTLVQGGLAGSSAPAKPGAKP
ncbi:MAG TPA: type IV pilus twitching motility protein PilT [Polyangia bacterium]|nr:type IV pilus twitching motility protein PilT [Polyangia bacterium]